ncbi:PIN domain-containing protein [Arhodomonas sp. AD133]|uniref:PIN domain-containing protein n=1 Tax=Arhodomonas sp. AD133 TaxID=3415009 RepID=UPI003EB79BD4
MLLVSDTNIIIDLETGGLVDELLALDEDVGVPDVLFHEELAAQHSYLEQAGLGVLPLEGKTMMRAFQLAGRYQKPSRNDLMAMALAEQERGVLLTGDQDLRRAAETEHVPVHGTIWVIGKMIDSALITPERANAAYEAMYHDGRRLPWAEVRRQLREYGVAPTVGN